VKLADLVENPQPDYQVGSIRVNASQYNEMLMRQLRYWEDKLKAIPKEDVSAVDIDVSEFGEDDKLDGMAVSSVALHYLVDEGEDTA